MRMSVIVRTLNSDHFTLYCKGSPEKIAELSRNETSKTSVFLVKNLLVSNYILDK